MVNFYLFLDFIIIMHSYFWRLYFCKNTKRKKYKKKKKKLASWFFYDLFVWRPIKHQPSKTESEKKV